MTFVRTKQYAEIVNTFLLRAGRFPVHVRHLLLLKLFFLIFFFSVSRGEQIMCGRVYTVQCSRRGAVVVEWLIQSHHKETLITAVKRDEKGRTYLSVRDTTPFDRCFFFFQEKRYRARLSIVSVSFWIRWRPYKKPCASYRTRRPPTIRRRRHSAPSTCTTWWKCKYDLVSTNAKRVCATDDAFPASEWLFVSLRSRRTYVLTVARRSPATWVSDRVDSSENVRLYEAYGLTGRSCHGASSHMIFPSVDPAERFGVYAHTAELTASVVRQFRGRLRAIVSRIACQVTFVPSALLSYRNFRKKRNSKTRNVPRMLHVNSTKIRVYKRNIIIHYTRFMV